MTMIKRSLFSMLAALLISSFFVSSVGAVTTNHYYLAARDEYVYTYSRDSWVTSMTVDYEYVGGGGNVSKTYTSLSGIYYMTCNGSYTITFNGSGGRSESGGTYVNTAIVNPPCDSYNGGVKNDLNAVKDGDKIKWTDDGGSYQVIKDGDKLADLPAGSTEYPTSGGGTYTVVSSTGASSDIIVEDDCADVICQCIRELLPVLESIDGKTGGILSELRDVVSPELKDINGVLKDIRSELRTNQTYSAPNVQDYPAYDMTPHKPAEPAPYRDDTVYFSDPGDVDEVPPPFPAAPEPTPWRDDQGNEMQPDQPLQRGEPMQSDPVMQPDPVMQSDPQLQRDPVLQRGDPLQVEEQEHELRWRVVDGQVQEGVVVP